MEIFNRNKYRFSNTPILTAVSDDIDNLREEQIESMTKELYEYDVLIQDLFSLDSSVRVRNILLNVAFYIVEEIEILDYVYKKKKLPINMLCKKTRLKKEFVESWKDYIITYVIIFANPNYKLIQDYMKIEENFNDNKEDKNKKEEVKEEKKKKNIIEIKPIEGNFKEVTITEAPEEEIKDKEKKDRELEDNKEIYSENEEDIEDGIRGIVIKIFKRSVCILTSYGEFKKIELKEGFIIGEEVTGKRKKCLKDYKKVIVIGVGILIILMGFFISKYYKIDRTILLNTTSQVKIDVNSFGRVISAYSPTSKGEEMVKRIKLKHKSIDLGMEEILYYAKDNSMIPEGRILITVTGDPIEFGTFKKTGEFIKENNMNVIINNAGNEQKLF